MLLTVLSFIAYVLSAKVGLWDGTMARQKLSIPFPPAIFSALWEVNKKQLRCGGLDRLPYES